MTSLDNAWYPLVSKLFLNYLTQVFTVNRQWTVEITGLVYKLKPLTIGQSKDILSWL